MGVDGSCGLRAQGTDAPYHGRTTPVPPVTAAAGVVCDTLMTRRRAMLRGVLVSFVLHLVPDELTEGRVVGSVIEVLSGREQPIRTVDELVSFCRDHGSPATGRDPGPEGPAPFHL